MVVSGIMRERKDKTRYIRLTHEDIDTKNPIALCHIIFVMGNTHFRCKNSLFIGLIPLERAQGI
jgi:hypothetical protein